MNIAIITPSLHYGGGAEKLVEFHAKELHRRGHKVRVYCIFDEGGIGEVLKNNGIKVINLQCFRALKNLYSSEAKTKQLYRITRFINEIFVSFRLTGIFLKAKPDIVHVYQNPAKMAILAGKICGVKKIIYTETSLIGDWFSPLQLSAIKIFWKFCDNIIALSSSMKDHMLKLKLTDGSKVCVIPSMFSLPESDGYYSDKKPNSLPVTIGTVGKLSPEKGHIYFLEAASLIAKQLDDVKFIIAGYGILREQLEALSKKLGIAEKVEFTGKFEDIGEIMKRMDIFVLASLTEGMPVSIIEAMAYGKPVVATDVGGVRELIKDGETGFVVPAKNPRALAKAIKNLIADSQRCKDFSNKAMEQFKDLYSSEKVISRIECLYRGWDSGKREG